jgi:hypothetical protein
VKFFGVVVGVGVVVVVVVEKQLHKQLFSEAELFCIKCLAK